MIAEADVDYKGKRPKKIWGVSDGEYVYLRVVEGQWFKNHYLRLQCDGPAPYLFYVDKSIAVAPGLGLIGMAALAAGTAALPPFVYLDVVRQHPTLLKPAWLATDNRIRNLFKDYPDLLDAYDKESKHNKAIKVKYLTEYNNRKLKG